jgi:hypothetical protein
MSLKWLKLLNKSTETKERFFPITHAAAVFTGDSNESTVENDLAKVGSVKGAGTGSVQAVDSESEANGNYSAAYGKGNLAKHFNTIFGKWANDSNITGSVEDSTSVGDLFAVGNGTSETSRSNALRLRTNGNLFIMGEYSTSGADYAEYFEWLDGNPTGEDRRGYFVTLDGEKIKLIDKDITESDFVLGAVSSFPGVIGNADEDWQGRWLKDEYGSLIVDNGSFVQNPDYDPTQKYIPRSDRKEWDAIGMNGVLVVRDDGTCEVNGYCRPVSGGISTKAKEHTKNTYRVIERINSNLIKIVF